MWLLFVLISALFFIWRYYKNAQNYWKDRGIDGPPSRLVFGNLWEMTDYNKPNGIAIHEWGKKYGKVFGVKEGVNNILIVGDASMLQELFVKKFDDFYARKESIMVEDPDNDPRVTIFRSRGIRWKRLRTIASASFSSNSLKKIVDTVDDSAIELVRLLETHVDGEAIDVHRYFQEFTMDVISRVAMGQSESKMFNNPTLHLANKIFQRDVRSPLVVTGFCIPFLTPVMKKLFQLGGQLQTTSIMPLFKQIYVAIDERIAHRERDAKDGMPEAEPVDFVDLFLNARAEGNIDNSADFSKNNVKVSRVLTRDEIAAQCFLFLLAGFDTTSNALSYVSFLLAKHPEVQKKVQKEIDEVCGNDQSLGFDAVNKLKYTEAVIKETLRLYPLASLASARSAMKDTTLGDIKIEKGTVIQADVWSLHYDNEIWGENADQFIPERWEDEKVKHNSAWIPFGSGPRICLGMRLAYLEAKLALAQILRRFDVVSGPKSEEKLRLVGATTMSPAAVTLYLKTRSIV